MNNKLIVLIFIFVISGIGMLCYLFCDYSSKYKLSERTVIIKVLDKERLVESSGDDITSRYIVYTDIGVFENTDSYVFSKYNSSDIQGKLRFDSVYSVNVAGWRDEFWSSYPNIININK